MGKAKDIKSVLKGLGADEGDFIIISESTDDPIQAAINKFVEQLKKNLNKDKRNASFNLYQSVGGDKEGVKGWEKEITPKGITIRLWLPEYYEYTDQGRKPTKAGGSGKVERSLQEWIANKKLVHSGGERFLQKWKLKDGTVKSKWVKKSAKESNRILAFLISRKIHRKGFKGSKWFTRAVPDFEKAIGEALGDTLGKMKINIELNGQKWQ